MRAIHDLLINLYRSSEKQVVSQVVSKELEMFIQELVAFSVPPTFHIEALKCQAMIMRTLVIRYMKTNQNPNMANGIDLSHFPQWKPLEAYQREWGQEYETHCSRLSLASQATKGKVILFNGKPIDAQYHQACGGATENSENVLGNVVAYLRRVLCDHCHESPYRFQIKEFTLEELEKKLGIHFSEEDVAKNLAIEEMLYDLKRDEMGRLNQLKVAGKAYGGADLVRLLELNSNRVSWRPQTIRFFTKGKGSGLGLCQYGANRMAQDGHLAEAILSYYYTGVEIVKTINPCIKTPLLGKVFVIDAAHGGEQGQDHVNEEGIREGQINLEIALTLEKKLLEAGAEVHMTRKSDLYVPLTERAQFANSIKPHFFLTIHQNYMRNSSLSGMEIYYYRGDEEAKRLAELMLAAVKGLGIANRGVKTADFFLLRDVKGSALHLETGYLSNPAEVRRLLEPAFQEALCQGLVDAIIEHFYYL